MKYYILLALLACISCQMLGKCMGTPKKLPLECYKGKVLNEDLPELQELLEKYKDGDDHEFADYLGDMYEKKDYRLGKTENAEEQKVLGKCGMHPKYQPYECYEPHVLRRNRKELKAAYDTLHKDNLMEFNKIYIKLNEAKIAYFEPKN